MSPSWRVNSQFDGGNIRVRSINGDRAELEIVADNGSDFYQWFFFRVVGAAGRRLSLRIGNAGGAAYPDGWPGYAARMSVDRAEWLQVPTRYEGGVLVIEPEVPADSAWFAYFAPYSEEQHHDLVASAALQPGVRYRSLGRSLDGREIDCLELGEGPLQVWLYGRQHPGETMAEWWMEGAIEKLVDPADPVARVLRRRATFHLVPNINPDGAARGHLRTNAKGVNLNREWHAPTAERSPEVLAVRNAMDETGVDFAIDAHGDEAIPAVFLAGFEGIAAVTERQLRLYTLYERTLERLSPDFQTKRGYPKTPAGRGNMSMSTTQLAERYGAVSMTLEMPFKDNDDLPDPAYGWSAERSKRLGEACLAALHAILGELEAG